MGRMKKCSFSLGSLLNGPGFLKIDLVGLIGTIFAQEIILPIKFEIQESKELRLRLIQA